MAVGDPLQPFKGTIGIALAADAGVFTTLNFIGSWSFSSEREFTDNKPKITPTSTGTRTRSPGARSAEGGLDGEVLQGANAGRAKFLTAEKTGELVQLKLEQTSGIGDTFSAYISGFELETDSEDGGTLTFSYVVSGEYEFVDVA